MNHFQLFATCPKALEATVAEELRNLGATDIKQTVAGVAFNGTLETAYRCCLWSRCANRILLILENFSVTTQHDLYRGINKINWFEHLNPSGSFAVSFSARNCKAINNTHFGALKVKDAIVDQMRSKFHKRPDIDTERPDIRINVHVNGDKAQLSLDLSGESLHKRGYRDNRVPAPIKENLAAAMLIRSKWPEIAEQNGTLIDPMCGSGTLLLEGALMAADYAPGLLRDYYGFLGWKKHEPQLWQQLLAEAEQRKLAGMLKIPVIVGFDRHRRAVNAASDHIQRAGLQEKLHLERRDILDAKPAPSWHPGLVICNPPYGERLGDEQETATLYQQFGEVLKKHFTGWQGAMILSNPELGFRLGIRSQKPVTLYNGALECKLLRFKIETSEFFTPKAKDRQQRIDQIVREGDIETISGGAEMFANRLRKNLKKLAKWAQRNDISCYRLYDADLPEYALAVDVYHGDLTRVHVQEYEAPKTVDRQKADTRLAEALSEIPKVLQISPEQVYFKIRRKQKSTDQYQKLAIEGQFHIVREGGCQLYVNLENYLDTGLFLDHRPIRLMLQQQSKGKRFLNLFAYTGSATVHAAAGGAKSTTSVDMSKTYLDWANRNMALNKLHGAHAFIQADCRAWLAEQAALKQLQYDLIFLDPPTFSNSKRMQHSFDVQQDHVELITNAAKILAPRGVLYFSTNFRRFKMDKEALAHLTLDDISAATIPEDFARNPKIHYCWRIKA